MLASIFFPPNFRRTFSNSLPASLPLPGHYGPPPTNGGSRQPLPPGNPQSGLTVFNAVCLACHRFNDGTRTGLSVEQVLLARSGTEGFFKIVQLRSLADKVGMDGLSPNSRAGFGFMHDGRVDTLTRFLRDGFARENATDQAIANFVALLLCFTGSDIFAPVTPSQDVPAATGRQVTFASPAPPPLLSAMFDLALRTNSRVELIVRGKSDGQMRSWLLRRATQNFQSDRHGEIVATLPEVIAAAAPGNEFTAILVPQGSGLRLGLDRDGDGYFDTSEAETGFNPADPNSHPGRIVQISKSAEQVMLTWQSAPGARYAVEWQSNLPPANLPTNNWKTLVAPFTVPMSITTYTDSPPANELRRFYRVRMER